jgi:single stranded DNA-binding protein
MNDTITIRGIVATDPRHLVTDTGLAITSFRLASPSRRWDRAGSAWVNGDTNWFTVTAFRSLASNCRGSVDKGDRVLVTGRLRVRTWERDDRSGLAVEIDADAIGHDLAYGRAQWRRTPRHTADETAAPGDQPSAEERAAVSSYRRRDRRSSPSARRAVLPQARRRSSSAHPSSPRWERTASSTIRRRTARRRHRPSRRGERGHATTWPYTGAAPPGGPPSQEGRACAASSRSSCWSPW